MCGAGCGGEEVVGDGYTHVWFSIQYTPYRDSAIMAQDKMPKA